jgi:hypothetical protein
MKNTLHFVLWITVLITVFFTMLLPVQAQTEWVEIKRGSGTLDGGNPSWTFFTVDLSNYSSGSLRAHISVEGGTGISRTGGKCWGGAQFAEEGFFKPENKNPSVSSPTTKVLVPNQTTLVLGNFSKPTKFILGVIPTCSPKLSSKFEYVIYIKNGKKVESNAPCKDDEIRVDYNKQALNYHAYTEETKICSTSSPSCTLGLVFSIMTSQIQYVVPDTKSTLKVQDCMTFDANIPGPFNEDPIRIIVNQDNFSVTNYTRKGHVFHPGKVTRSIVKKGNSIYVLTYGEGNGRIPTLNELVAPRYWKDVDNKLAKAVQLKLSGK